jgi:putative phosphoribosyl transferase
VTAATVRSHNISIPADAADLPGSLVVSTPTIGVVIFAHGSGSSRHSPRNQYVAQVLQQAGLSTVLFDLLTESEAADRRNVFDIDLLARRLLAAARWVMSQPATSKQPIGLFGASTGAAAALVAAAQEPLIRAVVSRGGRPDLAGPYLGRVTAPTLLIVGGDDSDVLALNRQALAPLCCLKRLSIVEGATHLFEEPGTLEQAAQLARDWFLQHLEKEMSP